MTRCIDSIEDLQDFVNNYKDIAFIPTMGNLHKGHLQLIKRARSLSKNILVSIFINPTQFNSKKDFDNYPRTIKKDKLFLKETYPECVIFSPKAKDILSIGHTDQYKISKLANDLCGKYRPGHFAGVINIINILFQLISPRFAIFGKKDYQQLIIINEFSKKYYPKINIISQDIIRDKNYLALSSRNSLLKNDFKLKANELYLALKKLTEIIKLRNDYKASEKEITSLLANADWDVEYISVRRQEDLKHATLSDKRLIVLGAAKLNNIRLIDNIEFCID